MRAFNLDPEQNWSEGAPCSDDGTGSGFKGVICDPNGNPRAMIPTLGNSLVGLRSLPTAFARLTTLTRLVLVMGLINTRLDDFARPLSCLPNLRHLVLDGNSFYGPVPPYLINSPTLTDLSLQGNKLTGTIRKIGPKLTALFLSVNFLTGPLPPTTRRLRVCNAAMNCLSRTSGCNGSRGLSSLRPPPSPLLSPSPPLSSSPPLSHSPSLSPSPPTPLLSPSFPLAGLHLL
ncbi:unnamed protein product [Closterium sp. Naga37s-1]|nr:unnamed protein product [Closterium sp. Naga37s-1]